jgi:PAS domain S-box-containing protein
MRLAEDELLEQKQFLEAVLGSMEQGVLVTDGDGRVSLWNDRACEILDIAPSVLQAEPTTEELRAAQQAHGDYDLDDPDIAAYAARWKDWMSSDGTDIFTHERQLANGTWMLVYGRKIPGGGTVRTLTDITERKTDEAEVLAAKDDAERARERLRAAMDAMPAGVVILDENLRYQTWNETYKQFAALTEEDILKHQTFDGLGRFKSAEVTRSTGEEFEAYLAKRRETFRTRQPTVRTEYWSSVEKHIELRVNPIPSGGWVSVYLDMTDRIEAEREIAEQSRMVTNALRDAEKTRERMRAILQSIPVGVLVYDPTMHIEFWNEAYCRFTGFLERALSNRPHFIDYSEFIFRAHDRGKDFSLEKFMEYRRRVYESDEKYVMEFFFDATGLDVQYTVASLPDGGRVNVIVDISQQKQAERAALDARDAAEEATRAKSAFLAAMSHEIRTPMNGVIGMAEVLEQTDLDEDQKTISGTIRESGQILLRIIDDILDFSKIEAGRMELEAEPVDLRQIAESVLESVAPAADAKELDLVVELEETAPGTFIGDPVRLHQVLLNLVGNAVKFTEIGSVRIHATARPDPSYKSGVRLRIEVTDTGVGIDPERMGHLFQPFQQAEASTTRRFGGTGLGLSICRRLVGMMHGEIGVDSTLGVGSTFLFEIPVEPSILIDRSDLDDLSLSGLTVVVVARPGPTGDQVAETLAGLGMRVQRVYSLADAESRLPSDVVILDGRLGADVVQAAMPAVGEPDPGASHRSLWVANGRQPQMSPVAVARPARRESLVRAVAAVLGQASLDVPSLAQTAPVTSEDLSLVPSADEAMAAGRLILVVEDNATNRLVVERQLAILGLAAETAVDGVEALLMWRKKPYGLVLTDCHMPNMDGYQLTGAIRAEEEKTGGRVPIVALTANALVGEAERCLEAGMDDYLAKPVTLDVMGETLARWLGKQDRGAVPASEGPQPEPAGPSDAPAAEPEPPIDEPAADPVAESPIDLVHLEQILGSAEPEFVAAMLQLFRDSYQNLEGRMRDAIADRDAAELREASHAAKGASANACATRLRAALEQLELAAAAGDWERIPSIWDEVGVFSDEVSRYLDTMPHS